MIGLQEMQRRLEKEDNKETAKQVKEMLDSGVYDYDEINIYGTGMGVGGPKHSVPQTPIKQADYAEIKESIKKIPLREFLARSGTTGIAGAYYLIPTKIHQIMYDSAVQADITPDISITIIPADQIPGTTHKVDIAVDDSYVPKKFMSGGQVPTETIATTQATLDFSESFGVNFRITNDLIEDSQFDLIEMHVRNAGREMGEFAANEAAYVMITSTDGDGTLNTSAGGADTTTYTNVYAAWNENIKDGYVSDTFLGSHHLIYDAISQDTTFTQDANEWRNELVRTGFAPFLGLKPVLSEITTLTHATGLSSGAAYADLNSFVFAKDYALLTGRKRWLRLENYSDPVRDLVGAVVSSRQDSITIYNDSICKITET
jgi:hypothetical protein